MAKLNEIHGVNFFMPFSSLIIYNALCQQSLKTEMSLLLIHFTILAKNITIIQ